MLGDSMVLINVWDGFFKKQKVWDDFLYNVTLFGRSYKPLSVGTHAVAHRGPLSW